MAKGYSKCVICEESFLKEETEDIKGKKYCKVCSLIKKEEIKQEILNRPPKEKKDWDFLFDIICEVYSIKVPTGMMFQQLKNYRSDGYNFTDIGMYYTLKYYYKTLGNPVKEATALGIIPYFYEKARIHFSKVFDIQDLADNINIIDKTIYIHTKLMDKSINKFKPLDLDILRKEIIDDEESN